MQKFAVLSIHLVFDALLLKQSKCLRRRTFPIALVDPRIENALSYLAVWLILKTAKQISYQHIVWEFVSPRSKVIKPQDQTN